MLHYHAMKTEDGWRPIVVVAKGDGAIQEGFPNGEHLPLWQGDDLYMKQVEALTAARDRATLIISVLEDGELVKTLTDELGQANNKNTILRQELNRHLVNSVHDGNDVWTCTGTTTCDCMDRRAILTRINK